MTKTRSKKHDGALKARVALEAIKGHKTISELASIYRVHTTQISNWKKAALEELPKIFSGPRARVNEGPDEALTAALYQQIGQLKVELDWLKKKCERLT